MEPRALAAAIADAPGFALAARQARLCAVCVALLVCVACCPAVPSLAVALARARSRLAFAPRVRRTAHARAMLGDLLLTTAGWALVAHVASVGKLPVDTLTPYVAFAAMGAAAGLVSGPARFGERLRAAGAYLVSALVVGGVLAVACALGGTRSMIAMVDAQGTWPWQWALFHKPALFAAFAAYVGHAGRMLSLPESAGVLVHGAQPLGRLVLCGLGACVFLGGWQGPVSDVVDPDVARSLGVAAFVVKAWLLAAFVDLAHRAGAGRTGLTTLALLLTVFLGAFAIVFPPAPAFEASLGVVAFATIAIVFALALLVVVGSSHPMGEGPTHPAPFG